MVQQDKRQHAFVHRWSDKQRNRVLDDRPRETQFENVSHRSLIERMVRPAEGASAPINGTTDINCDAVVTTQRLKSRGY